MEKPSTAKTSIAARPTHWRENAFGVGFEGAAARTRDIEADSLAATAFG
jgi:hypothetical protein